MFSVHKYSLSIAAAFCHPAVPRASVVGPAACGFDGIWRRQIPHYNLT